MAAAETAVQEVTETAPAKTGKTKIEKTGNLILDIAAEVEGMTKTKALNEAEKLAEAIEVDYFKLGGVLKVIQQNGWFEGYDSFEQFVIEKYGFQGRKARYLMNIYDNLVTKQIPWEKVSGLGWTKLKDLAPILTPETVDEWVAKAVALSVVELKAAIDAQHPNEEGEKTAKTTADIVKIKFNLKTDQAEIVQQALAKAKGELHTEYDSVALENIAAGYLGGNTSVAAPNIVDLVKSMGFEVALGLIADAEEFKQYDIVVKAAEPK